MFERTYSPPQLAKIWGVNPDKIRGWVARGQLQAANLGDRMRPRLRITEGEAARFWASRSAKKPAAKPMRKIDKPTKNFF